MDTHSVVIYELDKVDRKRCDAEASGVAYGGGGGSATVKCCQVLST
jgi:hypothetical protein